MKFSMDNVLSGRTPRLLTVREWDCGIGWKSERLCLQQQYNLMCQDRPLGCGCIATRRLELFLTYPAVGAHE